MTDLRDLEDERLVESLRRLETRHRTTMADIVAHLAEMERRRLHAALGYSSLYEYCTRALGLSEDEAYRRITAARLATQHPAILAGLADGSLHLSGLVALKPHFRAETSAELLEMARGVSRRELERRLAARFPEADSPQAARAERGTVRPVAADRYRLELTIHQATKDKLERALELMSHDNPSHALGPVVDAALDVLVEKLDRARRGKLVGRRTSAAEKPVGRHAPKKSKRSSEARALAGRRKSGAREKVRATLEASTVVPDDRQLDLWEFAAERAQGEPTAPARAADRAAESPAPARKAATVSKSAAPARNTPNRTSPSRHIPRPLRRAAFQKEDQGCCFMSAEGQRCGSRHFLEVDHRTPWSLDRRHELANLRLLCRAHNQLMAEGLVGTGK